MRSLMVRHETLESMHALVTKKWKKARFVVRPLVEHMDKRASQRRALQVMRAMLDRWIHGTILGSLSIWKQNYLLSDLEDGVVGMWGILRMTTKSVKAVQLELVRERYHGAIHRLRCLVGKLCQISLAHSFYNWERCPRRGGRIDVVVERWDEEDAELKATLDAAELWRRERKECVRYHVERELMRKAKVFTRAKTFMTRRGEHSKVIHNSSFLCSSILWPPVSPTKL